MSTTSQTKMMQTLALVDPIYIPGRFSDRFQTFEHLNLIFIVNGLLNGNLGTLLLFFYK